MLLEFENAIANIKRDVNFRNKELHLYCELILNTYVSGEWLHRSEICGYQTRNPNIEMGMAKKMRTNNNKNANARLKKYGREIEYIDEFDFCLKYACQNFRYERRDLYTLSPFQYIYPADDESFFRYFDINLNRMSKMKRPFLPSPDHIIPLAKGGRNNIDNIVFVTRYQNTKKNDDTLHFYSKANNLDKDHILSRKEIVDALFYAAKEDEKLRNAILEHQKLTSPFLDIEQKLLEYIQPSLVSDDMGF